MPGARWNVLHRDAPGDAHTRGQPTGHAQAVGTDGVDGPVGLGGVGRLQVGGVVVTNAKGDIKFLPQKTVADYPEDDEILALLDKIKAKDDI